MEGDLMLPDYVTYTQKAILKVLTRVESVSSAGIAEKINRKQRRVQQVLLELQKLELVDRRTAWAWDSNNRYTWEYFLRKNVEKKVRERCKAHW